MDAFHPPAASAAAVSVTLGWRGELKALFALAWPLVVAQLAQMALLTTDVIMMGWLGPQYLAAGNLTAAFINLFQLGAFGLVGAVAPMAAQAIGAGEGRSVRRTVRQGCWLSIMLSVLLMPLYWSAGPILLGLGQTAETARLGESFAHYALWMTLPALLLVVLRSFLSAVGDTRSILAVTLIGVAVNALLDYGLMFGNFGLPRLELAGSGISTTTANIVMFALTLAYVLVHPGHRRYELFANFRRADWPRLGELVRIGLPIGLMTMAEVGVFTASQVMQGWLGTDQLAAHAIALQLAAIAFMVPLGLAQAATVRVGIAYGAGDHEGVRKAGWTAMLLALGFMSTTCLLYTNFAHPLVGLFLDPADPTNSAALRYAASYLLVVGLFQLFDGAQVTAAAALRGLSDTAIPLVVAILGYWLIGLPIGYFTAFHLGMQGIGIWIGLASGLAFVAIVLTIRFALRERLGLVGGSKT